MIVVQRSSSACRAYVSQETNSATAYPSALIDQTRSIVVSVT